MAIRKELLEILACPETKQPLSLADTALVETLNERIRQRQVTNRGGESPTHHRGS